MKEQDVGTICVEDATALRTENTALRAENAELKSQVDWLMEQLRLLKKKQFGASSEQTKEELDGQLSLLFNEAEAYAAPPGRQKTTQVAAHTRKQSGSVRDVVPPNRSPAKRVRFGEEEQGSVCSFRRRRKRNEADFATTR